MVITTLAFAVMIPLAGDPSLGTALVVLSVLSKIASNVGWFIMWVQCIEVFPTPLRGTGMNLCVMISTVVTMSGPYVVDLVSQPTFTLINSLDKLLFPCSDLLLFPGLRLQARPLHHLHPVRPGGDPHHQPRARDEGRAAAGADGGRGQDGRRLQVLGGAALAEEGEGGSREEGGGGGSHVRLTWGSDREGKCRRRPALTPNG